MGIIADVSAMVKVQKIKKGGVAKLSVAQIAEQTINLSEAERVLTEKQYNELYAVYTKLRELNVKRPMDAVIWRNTVVEIIKEVDLIAPYESYNNGPETLILVLSLMQDIFGKNHQRIREIRRHIAAFETELKERLIADAENARIFAETMTDEQLRTMVEQGRFPANRVKEYIEARDNLASFVKYAPKWREAIEQTIMDLRMELTELGWREDV